MTVTVDRLDVDLPRMMRVLRAHYRRDGLHPGLPEFFGPSGRSVKLLAKSGRPEGSIIVSQAVHDSAEWVHTSIAWLNRIPEYEDLTTLKDAVFGPEREAYQVFPPASRHVSIHDYALHLWGRADGSPALPVFAADGTI